MRRKSLLAFALILASSCAGFPYGQPARPVDLYGTVTFVDPARHRIDLQLDDLTHYALKPEETSPGLDQNRRAKQSVPLFYDDSITVWKGVRADKIRTGDRVVISGRVDNGHWRAYSVSSRTD